MSLSACETGVISKIQEDEYVGLVSACLSRGVNYVLATLWEVEDLPSSMFVIYFYTLLGKGYPPTTACRVTTTWLQQLTYRQAAAFHASLEKWLPYPTRETSTSNRILAEAENPEERPFEDFRYWGAFTISGFAMDAG
jgi:CHAT domain-containing protein